MWYHLVGISGVSMRTIAKILQKQGHKVTGSDLKLSGHDKKNIVDGIDAVVYTSAITQNSAGWVEIEEAKKRNIELIKRGKILADLVSDRKVIAVSGTHGKTTTTSMIGLSMIKAGLDPLVIVGEEVSDLGSTFRYGSGRWAVVEACEYDRNFLYFHPQIAVITNIEEEHLDHYPGGISDLQDAFFKFASQVTDNGVVIACGDDKNTLEVVKELKKKKIKTITYGLGKKNDFNELPFDLSIPGDHNRRNALATLAVADIVNAGPKVVEEAIVNFHGAHRRFELIGEKDGVLVIDDYGHHPTEIAALLSGVKEKYPDRKVVTVFWPHQYKRTKAFLKKFPKALSISDKIVIKEIFFVPGRDEKTNVSGKDIVDLVNQEKSGKAVFINDDKKIVEYLNSILESGDVLVTVGIPPVYNIANMYLGKK
ncbi:MAG: UDP-N-acetylmuramate--L-alanine ligase [Patescibacteria group bacterium]|jgi:UDP-N-acetylmuramate--alanine ligase|nr:UDP-N-acetylmuramate--L-alanine ligase [Patescibacteria group bacterium]